MLEHAIIAFKHWRVVFLYLSALTVLRCMPLRVVHGPAEPSPTSEAEDTKVLEHLDLGFDRPTWDAIRRAAYSGCTKIDREDPTPLHVKHGPGNDYTHP